MGRSTISMAMFNSYVTNYLLKMVIYHGYVSHYQRVYSTILYRPFSQKMPMGFTNGTFTVLPSEERYSATPPECFWRRKGGGWHDFPGPLNWVQLSLRKKILVLHNVAYSKYTYIQYD